MIMWESTHSEYNIVSNLTVLFHLIKTLIVSTVFLHSSILFRSSIPELLHHPGSAYIFWNNRRIFMFKVSKRPYQSSRYDRIIGKWRQCLLGAQKWN